MNPEYTAHICREVRDIEGEIKAVSKFLVGEEDSNKADTLKGMYDKLMSATRNIFVNKGHDHTQLANELKVRNHKSRHADGRYWPNRGKVVSEDFNESFDKSVLNFGTAKAIADYAKSKGITIRRLFENNGINTSNAPKNTNLVTAKAYEDSVTSWAKFVGYHYIKAYYKGFNIDAQGAGETTVQILDCGYNNWKGDG